jgi:hypothetical protein
LVAIGELRRRYAEQNGRDGVTMIEAIAGGRVTARLGVR